MRNAGQRNRWRKRAVASLGKYHSTFARSQPDAEPFPVSERDTVCLVNRIGDAICFCDAYVRVSDFQPGSDRAVYSDAHVDESTRRSSKSGEET